MRAAYHYPLRWSLTEHSDSTPLSFNQYLLSANCVPSTHSGIEGITMRNSDNFFTHKEFIMWEKQTISKLISDGVKGYGEK